MSTPWQRRGETMSLARACDYVGGITEEECFAAKLEMRRKSYMGNAYPAVIVPDVEKLKKASQGEDGTSRSQVEGRVG
jgi:hypothetical protein